MSCAHNWLTMLCVVWWPNFPPSKATCPFQTRKLCYRKDDRAIQVDREPLRRYGHSKLSKMAAAAILNLFEPEIVPLDPASPKNPTLEPNMKWIGSPVAEIWPFAYVGGIWNPHFGGKGGRRGSTMAPFERAMVVSYRLSIVTVALSVTIRPEFAIECLQRSNQRVGDFGLKFRGVPLGADPSCWGCKERTSQAGVPRRQPHRRQA